ncbi:MAG: TIM-barrel domain-containing protein, partial [Pseudomonadota bacterium]
WFWQAYRRLFEQGAAGTWGDLGEPEVHPGDSLHTLSDHGLVATGDEIHNVYGHEWARLVYERQRQEFPSMRPAILMRSGFAGSQRYGIIPWTGDVNRSWGGLEPQIELALQMGLFGLGYTHSDLGGFAGGDAFDRELYLRWLQYGVFQPVYRPHAQAHIPPEPVYHDALVRDIAGDAIRLRYRMLPYNYTLAHENSLTGLPMMRPVFFEDESDLSLIDVRDRYLWGDAFLVAPVREAGVEQLQVPLPDGIWFDFATDRRYNGDRTVTVATDMNSIPVFVRGGSFIPMLPSAVANTASYSSSNLELHYYSDPVIATAQGQMYEDDGRDPGSLDAGRFEILEFDAHQSGDQLTLNLARRGDGYVGMPAERTITLVVHNWLGELSSVSVGEVPLRVRRRLPGRGTGAALDSENKQLTIRIVWNHAPVKIQIN